MLRGQGLRPKLLPFAGYTAVLAYVFDVGRASSTLKVYVAAILVNHGMPVGA